MGFLHLYGLVVANSKLVPIVFFIGNLGLDQWSCEQHTTSLVVFQLGNTPYFEIKLGLKGGLWMLTEYLKEVTMIPKDSILHEF